jgi:Holliday junction DNA helicase RuvA
MIAYIEGQIKNKLSNYVIIDIGGMGYEIYVSLHTLSKIKELDSVKLFTYFYIKENAQILYGFIDILEKQIFSLLISVKGIGPTTALGILSHLTYKEFIDAILAHNVQALKVVKGLGAKASERIILELKDKLIDFKSITNPNEKMFNFKNEAVGALTKLGINKNIAETTVDNINKQNPSLSIEDLIKKALQSCAF